MKTFTCKHCGTENKWNHSSTNQYCNLDCAREARTIKLRERWISGECLDSATQRKYLIEDRGETCEDCGVGTEWNGKPLTLHIDHIDGNSDNNMPDNLRFLCPNCHSQQDTTKQRQRKETRRNRYLRNYKMRD